MPAEFLLEIGTEEIPSGYFEQALSEWIRITKTYLREYRIGYSGEIFTYCTPRRIVFVAEALNEKQEDIIQEVTGPPKQAAFDQNGSPTRAASGFTKKYDVSMDDLQIVETPKGEYLYLKREIPGRPTIEILSEILPRLISEVPWPKSMRWGDIGFPFVRPIHWVLSLFGGNVVPFEIAGIKSGNRTMGHRFMAPRLIEIRDFRNYLQEMKRCSVMVNQEERRKTIENEVTKKAKEVSGIPVKDPELVRTVSNLVEFPSCVCGRFDHAFLTLPAPVLITSMREHQKYFAVQDKNGQLMPFFIAVNNTTAKDESVVRKGHERVLRARLSDAVFFFNEDRKRPLEERLKDLKGVIYQAELGTSFAKVERFTRLALFLAEKAAPGKRSEIRTAARLCKCDLVTEMVMEFPTLQGVMGGEYARLDGHPEEICNAIREHYLPVRAGDALPASIIGTIVGLADRMDTIAGCFAIGLEPTGAADPFALRRHVLSIIRMVEDRLGDLSLNELIQEALSILEEEITFDGQKVFNSIRSFFRERYKNRMLGEGYESDLIEAVLSARFDKIGELPERMAQLNRFMTEFSEFRNVVLTFKRVTNILKKQEISYSVDETLLREDCESDLWEGYQGVKDEINRLTERKEYFQALSMIAGLRKGIDDFFDGVEVLTKESPVLRKNRLAILHNLARLFLGLADFSRFSI